MKHLAAYLLLVAGGNTSPSAEDLKTILGSVGVEVDASRVAALIKAFEGKTAAQVRIKNFFFSFIEKKVNTKPNFFFLRVGYC